MKKNYSAYFPALPTTAAWLGPVLLLAAVAGCQNETVQLPNPGPEYYPVAVGAYRIYDVADTSWRNNVPTASRFQFREQVAAELSPDATGQPVYRVVRSRRATPADAWATDSVLTVTVGRQTLTEQRNGRRTVELVFPVVEGNSWNTDTFFAPDTSRVLNRVPNRYYRQAGQAFSIARAGKTYSYQNTVTTLNDLDAANGINVCGTTVLRTTYAEGIGPVYRVRRRFSHELSGSGTCNPAIKYLGQSRSEVLIESGN
ncbi:hypothetical protein [Hymenobacter sp. UYP22]|uniref:hypothetical protein n=1 Tax=Hymenobacter sp. UYP22 TaxID=3156348 RepID=UPI0033942E4B